MTGVLALVGGALVASPGTASAATLHTVRFTRQGSDAGFRVPAGVTLLDIVAIGARGAGAEAAGGSGAKVVGHNVPVAPGQSLNVYVAPQNTGGASYVGTCAIGHDPGCTPTAVTATDPRITVAGGGGGSGRALVSPGSWSRGGNAAAAPLDGVNGGVYMGGVYYPAQGGRHGALGGAGGIGFHHDAWGGCGSFPAGSNGTPGFGGPGGSLLFSLSGGRGGDGWVGGGGGGSSIAFCDDADFFGAGGGGGSSYSRAAAGPATAAVDGRGNALAPSVTIQYYTP
ncbi:hypothetical protein ACFYYB_41130 [Streptomyces sp. NPDC002886]|uniref:hypothetical protein n=1 Tax=Streptomyces sp. NPDC002886 TaxID=3364667 RepID=UPI003695EB05